MKKIYLSALALSIGTLSFGQVAKQSAFKTNNVENVKAIKQLPQEKGLTLWSNDFSTPGDWVLSASGDSWVIGTGVPTGAFAIPGIMSTTAANGFALFDSDALCSGSQDATVTIASPINLSANANVSLVFEEQYRKFQDQTFVGVSTDGGTTWTDFEVNAAVPANGSTANPQTVTVNISAVAGNQAAVLIRFQFVGGCDYAWMVDDVEIQETDANDLVAFDAYYGSLNVPYTRIPVAQIQPIDFAMQANNIGFANQTGTILTADINSGVFTGTSSPVTIAAGASDSLVTTTQFTPPATTGIAYTVDLTVSSDFTDATPGDNTISFPPFEVSQYIYAQDDYAATPGNGGGEDGNNPGSFEFEAGNYYDIVANADAYGIDVFIGSNAVANEEVDAVLYRVSTITGIFVEVARSSSIVTTAADAGTLHQFRFTSAIALTADSSYFAAVHSLGNTDFFYGTSGRSAANGEAGGTTSLVFYPNMSSPATGQNYYTTQTPMVRLNFDPSAVGINDIAANNVNFDVYPNPSTGEFNINLNNDMGSAVSLTVKNVVGQTIINKEIAINGNQVETISLAGYDKGIYFLTINNKTVKLIVE